MDFEKYFSEKSKTITISEPLILNLAQESDCLKLQGMIDAGEIRHISDDYEEQIKEFFQATNPSLVYRPEFSEKFGAYLSDLKRQRLLWQQGRWVYFPWLSTLVHILEDEDFQTARTARNRNLINKEEQDKFYNSVVGIAGLSVGSSVAIAMVLQGGGRVIRLADHDRLALSNTNRIRTGIHNLGALKTEMAAREIYAINPYAKVELFSDGLSKDNIDKFFEGPPKLSIVIDEIDNLAVKYLIRERAKKHRLAVVMAADNGDNGVVDVERYDLDPQPEFFHGRMGEVTYDTLAGLDKFGIGKMITKHVGPENVTERMQQSLLEMGKTVVSWPQLGGAAMLNGSAVAYCVRKILNGQPLINNRAIISMDEKLTPGYNSMEEVEKRKKVSEDFKKIFGL